MIWLSSIVALVQWSNRVILVCLSETETQNDVHASASIRSAKLLCFGVVISLSHFRPYNMHPMYSMNTWQIFCANNSAHLYRLESVWFYYSMYRHVTWMHACVCVCTVVCVSSHHMNVHTTHIYVSTDWSFDRQCWTLNVCASHFSVFLVIIIFTMCVCIVFIVGGVAVVVGLLLFPIRTSSVCSGVTFAAYCPTMIVCMCNLYMCALYIHIHNTHRRYRWLAS